MNTLKYKGLQLASKLLAKIPSPVKKLIAVLACVAIFAFVCGLMYLVIVVISWPFMRMANAILSTL